MVCVGPVISLCMETRPQHKWLMLLGCTLGLFLVLALASGNAQAQDDGQGLPYDEKEAQSIDRMLLCPVCPAESIDQAQVPIARQMRSLVRQMLAQGTDRDEILDFFSDRYGLDVLAAPPKSGVNLLVWVLPPVLILAALGGGFVIIRAMAARGAGEAVTGPPPEEGLEPYLEAIDRDLDLPGVRKASVQSLRPEANEPASGASNADVAAVEPRREEGFTQDG